MKTYEVRTETGTFPVGHADLTLIGQPDRCPDCGAAVRGKTLQEGGGVECYALCGWWFCH